MNYLLLDFSKSFVDGRLSADVFSEAYIELWRIERDNKNILNYDVKISENLSSIFCLADMYNPDDDREDYEFSEEQLRDEIRKLIFV
ncbi:colicin immunity domain-containing protein [Pantoea ananatis]|uniref:colicin immunity domain-containing protein n=1 Tax=Pantoea ananas TaxID=553 RepID=UPI000CF466B5|nr:colicin immunity domain-containing protein [Pantoea ananatis]MBA4823311.1 colicin immunity protein [Pantoea ananatis]MCW1834311.1 colicin immunity domain-containing protein [Pantoea ananatis]PQL00724.1 colicin immunity protein [Pantoea ananatis]PQL07320.1 colicin immunity protein [Pantoea ananatis]QKV87463.1 colicin immunity protein [Pantoea ananatis]